LYKKLESSNIGYGHEKGQFIGTLGNASKNGAAFCPITEKRWLSGALSWVGLKGSREQIGRRVANGEKKVEGGRRHPKKRDRVRESDHISGYSKKGQQPRRAGSATACLIICPQTGEFDKWTGEIKKTEEKRER